ncbi:hypothetical protein [Sodalis sp. RH18]|uniref:hypothetical protein n=1 Tax=Sodalis sp. RH18 TaxID=3394333 RepID=UPI0039B3ED8F
MSDGEFYLWITPILFGFLMFGGGTLGYVAVGILSWSLSAAWMWREITLITGGAV